MSFDIDGFNIREEGYQRDLKAAQDAISAELRKKYEARDKDLKNRHQEALDQAKRSEGLSHMRSKAIKDAKEVMDMHELKVKKEMQAELKKQLQERKEFLSKKHFEDVGKRDEQVKLARQYKKQQAIDASLKSKEEFKNVANKKRTTEKFNQSVQQANREKIEARRSRLKEGKQINAVNLQRSNRNPDKGR